MAGKPSYEQLRRTVKKLQKETAECAAAMRPLKEREATLRTLLGATPDSILLLDSTGKIISINEVAAQRLGKSPHEVEGKCVFDLLPSDLAEDRKGRLTQIFRSGKPIRFEDQRAGIWFDNVVKPVFDEQGKVAQVAVFARDITALKRTGEELRSSETRLRRIIDKSADGIVIVDRNGIVRFANPAAEALLDRESKEFIGEMFGFPSVANETTEIRVMRGDGEMAAAEMRVVNVDWNGEAAYIASLKDLSERELAKAELDRLATAIEQAAESFVITDKECKIQYVNPAFERITGYAQEELIGRTPAILKSGRHDDKFYREMWDTLSKGNVWRGHLINRKRNGSLYEEEATIAPIRGGTGKIINYVAVKRDLTDVLRLERQLTEVQKMEAIGTLSGGIAHDFNNILGAISGYTELVGLEIPDDSHAKSNLKEVLKATRRAKDLVNQILALSRHSEQERKPVQISHLLKEALKFLRVSLPSTIEIRQHIDRDAGVIEADPTQIHQVLMNLGSNSAHAIGENGGVLEVSLTRANTATEKYVDVPPGDYVKLTVSDSGHGMSPEVLERIFDPYFTTKEKGKGTGLGLAVVHGIVKSHGGAIKVLSVPGKGSTFNIYFPRIEGELTVKTEEVDPLPTGHEHILFVDDEQALVDIGKKMLRHLGYQVTTKTSGTEALNLFQDQPDRFDLVMTDMTMPHITGDQLARALSSIRADIPVILCTGYSAKIDAIKAKAMGIRAFIMKPVIMQEMAHTIREVLDEGVEKEC